MASREKRAEALRPEVKRAVAERGPNQVARELGMSPSWVQTFMEGSVPYAPTLDKIERWAGSSDRARLVTNPEDPDVEPPHVREGVPPDAVERMEANIVAGCKYLDARPIDPAQRKARKLDALQNEKLTYVSLYGAVPDVWWKLKSRIEADEL